MQGFMYRLAVTIKDVGERLRIRGIIRMGLWLREGVIRYGKVR